MSLDKKSLAKLEGVHHDLVQVILKAVELSPVEFVVTEGLRSVERQAEMVKKGASQTMRSRHITGHAVDLAPKIDGQIRWDWPLFYKLAPAVKLAALSLKIPLEWGGEWKKFPDGPHFQLPWEFYP